MGHISAAMPSRRDPYPESVDLFIIGGGITGAGIARDAARRGLTVFLADQNDLAFGTSSRSSKLVHGGLRYLEQYEFGLVFESVSERGVLLHIAPHLVTPLGFLFPVFEHSRRGVAMIRAGMWLYDALSLGRSPERHRFLTPSDLQREEPSLGRDALKGAPLYYDCATDDARLTLESAIDAAAHGATIATWTKVEELRRDRAGLVREVVVRDVLSAELATIRAGVVVNATGPWTDRTLAIGADGQATERGRPWLRPTRGVHIVVEHRKLPLTHAVVCFHPDDGRVLFAIPWGDRTYVGTTDTDDRADPGDVHADDADIRYLLRTTEAYFPAHPLVPADVISTWAGLRPLVVDDQAASESDVSREHRIETSLDGLVTVAGGKLTTYRLMAREVVEHAMDELALRRALPPTLRQPETGEVPLPGGRAWPEGGVAALQDRLRAEYGDVLRDDTLALLARTYGTRAFEVVKLVRETPDLARRLHADRPEIVAQIDFAIEAELATRLVDVLIRRTQIFFRNEDQGLSVAEDVARRMARHLGWSDERILEEVAAFEHEVELSRRWRHG